MTFGQRLALNLSPLLLRLGLAFVFIYAGAGKLFYNDMPVTGPQAAWLANNGFIDESKLPVTAPPPVSPTPTTPETRPPAQRPPAQPPPAESEDEAPEATPDEPTPEPDEHATPPVEPKGDPEGGAPATSRHDASAGFALVLAQNEIEDAIDETHAEPAGRFSAADFAEPIPVSRRLGLVLMMHNAAAEADWPSQLASPAMLGILSWMAVLTEFVGGWLVLLGFLTRFWALGLAGVMVVAMWLTQIAPSIGNPDAFLGFLPELKINDPLLWTKAWQTLELQLVLLLAAMAVFFSGPGKVSLDAVLFSRPARRRTTKPAGDAAA